MKVGSVSVNSDDEEDEGDKTDVDSINDGHFNEYVRASQLDSYRMLTLLRCTFSRLPLPLIAYTRSLTRLPHLFLITHFPVSTLLSVDWNPPSRFPRHFGFVIPARLHVHKDNLLLWTN
jgi:hypothetical protein